MSCWFRNLARKRPRAWFTLEILALISLSRDPSLDMVLPRHLKFSTTLSSVSSWGWLVQDFSPFQGWWSIPTAVRPECAGDHSLCGPWVRIHQRREFQEWASGLSWFGTQATQVKEGSVMSVLQVHALVQIFHCVVEDPCEEKVKQHRSQDAPLLNAIGDVKAAEVAPSDSISPVMSSWNRRMLRTNFLGHQSFVCIAHRAAQLMVSEVR